MWGTKPPHKTGGSLILNGVKYQDEIRQYSSRGLTYPSVFVHIIFIFRIYIINMNRK